MWLFKAKKASLAVKQLGEDSDLFHEVRVGLRFIQTSPTLPAPPPIPFCCFLWFSLSRCLWEKGPGKGDIGFIDTACVVAPLWRIRVTAPEKLTRDIDLFFSNRVKPRIQIIITTSPS